MTTPTPADTPPGAFTPPPSTELLRACRLVDAAYARAAAIAAEYAATSAAVDQQVDTTVRPHAA